MEQFVIKNNRIKEYDGEYNDTDNLILTDEIFIKNMDKILNQNIKAFVLLNGNEEQLRKILKERKNIRPNNTFFMNYTCEELLRENVVKFLQNEPTCKIMEFIKILISETEQFVKKAFI